MASDRDPSDQWQLRNGQAWVFRSRSNPGLVRPLILAADVQNGPTDMAALVAKLDNDSYSFLSALRSVGRDLVVLGYSKGNTGLAETAETVIECVRMTAEVRLGDARLTVGGVGRGALATRYGLAKMEWERLDHQTGIYFSYNGSAPSTDEAAKLQSVGGWPQVPRLLQALSAEFSELLDDYFDANKVGAANQGSALITQELGSWIIDSLNWRSATGLTIDESRGLPS
jgi:hypothetical protein